MTTLESGETTQFLTVQEACRIARVGPTTMFKWMRDGRFDVVRIGRRKTLIPAAGLQRFLAQHAKPAVQQQAAA